MRQYLAITFCSLIGKEFWKIILFYEACCLDLLLTFENQELGVLAHVWKPSPLKVEEGR